MTPSNTVVLSKCSKEFDVPHQKVCTGNSVSLTQNFAMTLLIITGSLSTFLMEGKNQTLRLKANSFMLVVACYMIDIFTNV